MNVFAVVRDTEKRIHAEQCGGKGRVVYPKGHFSCIDCSNNVHVKRGDKRAWHFSHYSSKDGAVCPHKNGGETEEHYYAKHFIAQNIHRCVFQTGKCKRCWTKILFPGANQCIAEVEKRIPGTSKVADVLLSSMHKGKARAAVEVFHTHAVDADKRDACRRQGVAILEVTTAEVDAARQLGGSSGGAIVMRTVDCANGLSGDQICTQCVMASSFRDDLYKQQRVWAWYDAKWAEIGKMHQKEYVAREMAAWLKVYEAEQAEEMMLVEMAEREEEMMCVEMAEQESDVQLVDPQIQQHLSELNSQPQQQQQQKELPEVDMREKNRVTALRLDEEERKRKLAEEESARKRLALQRLMDSAVQQNEMYTRRRELLKSMQDRDVREGRGLWSNAYAWRAFHSVTEQLLAEKNTIIKK